MSICCPKIFLIKCIFLYYAPFVVKSQNYFMLRQHTYFCLLLDKYIFYTFIPSAEISAPIWEIKWLLLIGVIHNYLSQLSKRLNFWKPSTWVDFYDYEVICNLTRPGTQLNHHSICVGAVIVFTSRHFDTSSMLIQFQAIYKIISGAKLK